MTTYRVHFRESALKEFKKLGATLQVQFKKKLKQRLTNPRVSSDALRGMPDAYKIKLRSAGYRLVYTVDDVQQRIIVETVGKRDGAEVYEKAKERVREPGDVAITKVTEEPVDIIASDGQPRRSN